MVIPLRIMWMGVKDLDGSPFLDTKPYVPESDTFEVRRCGWIDDVDDEVRVADSRFQR